MRSVLGVLVLLLMASIAQAQTVVNPTLLEFQVSADHNGVDVFNQPVVTAYEYVATGMNGNGAVVVTVGIVKPVASDGATVQTPLPGLGLLTLNALYTATVAAKGQGGTTSGPSVASNPFGVAGPPKVPAKPSNVKAKP